MAEGAKNPEVWKAAAMQDHFDKIQKLKVLNFLFCSGIHIIILNWHTLFILAQK